MKIEDAPLHQYRWRTLVDGSLGQSTAEYVGDDKRLTYVQFGARGNRRFRVTLSPGEAHELKLWLTAVLAGQK